MIWEIDIAGVGTVSYDLQAKTYARAWRETKSRFGAAARDLRRPARKYRLCEKCGCKPCCCGGIS